MKLYRPLFHDTAQVTCHFTWMKRTLVKSALYFTFNFKVKLRISLYAASAQLLIFLPHVCMQRRTNFRQIGDVLDLQGHILQFYCFFNYSISAKLLSLIFKRQSYVTPKFSKIFDTIHAIHPQAEGKPFQISLFFLFIKMVGLRARNFDKHVHADESCKVVKFFPNLHLPWFSRQNLVNFSVFLSHTHIHTHTHARTRARHTHMIGP